MSNQVVPTSERTVRGRLYSICLLLVLLAVLPGQILAQSGESLDLDGTTDAVQVSNSDALNVYPLTIEAWIKTTEMPAGNYWGGNNGGGVIACKYRGSSRNGYSFHLNSSGGLSAWYYRSNSHNLFGSAFETTFLVADGNWHHVALVVDASGGKIYVDAVERASIAWTGTAQATTSTEPLFIGKNDASSFFDGLIDEVRFWGVGRSQTELNNNKDTELAGTEADLLLYYKFDDGTGFLKDCTANSNFGCEVGTPTGAIDIPSITDVACSGGGSLPIANVQGQGMDIPDGTTTTSTTDDTDFGTVLVGSNDTHTFTIENDGSGNLTINSIGISGTEAADFAVSGITLPITLGAGATTTFDLTFTPGGADLREATVTVNNTICSADDYTFAVSGTGCDPSGDIVVNSTADNTTAGDGDCTLREAIINANGGVDVTDCDCAVSTTITFDASANGTITLGSALPQTTTSISITGNGSSNTIIDGGTSNAIFNFGGASSVVTIADLTVQNGTTGITFGASSLDVTLNGVKVDNNSLRGIYIFGGGVAGSSLELNDCTISDNDHPSSWGAGIYANSNSTTIIVNSSLFSGNTASGWGGAINLQSNGGSLTVDNSCFQNNTAQSGAAIHTEVAGLTVTNSTFTGNEATDGASGKVMFIRAGGTFKNCTFSENIGVDVLSIAGSPRSLINSIIVNNTATNDLNAGLTTNIQNVVGSCVGGCTGMFSSATDVLGTLTSCTVNGVALCYYPVSATGDAYGNADAGQAPATDICGTARPTAPSIGSSEALDCGTGELFLGTVDNLWIEDGNWCDGSAVPITQSNVNNQNITIAADVDLQGIGYSGQINFMGGSTTVNSGVTVTYRGASFFRFRNGNTSVNNGTMNFVGGPGGVADGGASLTNNGDITMGTNHYFNVRYNSTFTNNGNITYVASAWNQSHKNRLEGSYINSATGVIDLNEANWYIFEDNFSNSGLLTGIGTLRNNITGGAAFNVGGRVAPGLASTGIIGTVNDVNFNGTVEIEITGHGDISCNSGTAGVDFDRITNSGGTIDLTNATVEFDFGGVTTTPDNGDQYRIFTGTVTGTPTITYVNQNGYTLSYVGNGTFQLDAGGNSLADISVNDSGNTDFGTVAVGGSSTLTYTITNDGGADLTVNTIGSDDAQFVVGNLSTTLPATLAPTGTMTFDVVFSPASVAALSGNISIGSDDCDENPYTFGVTGTGDCPASWVVTNTNDSGPGSLRQTIADAIASACTPIVIDATGIAGVIALTGGEIPVSAAMTINGPGAGVVIVDAGNNSRVFDVTAGPTDINDFSFLNGNSGANNGGVINTTAVINVAGCTFMNSCGNQGSAIYLPGGADGSTISSSVFSGCAATGGGVIYTSTGLTMTDCIVENNTSSGGRGAGIMLFNNQTVNIDRCIFRGNDSSGEGAALWTNGSGAINISNTVISGNDAGQSCGGLAMNGSSTVTATNITVSGNGPSAGILNWNGTLNVTNSIVYDNSVRDIWMFNTANNTVTYTNVGTAAGNNLVDGVDNNTVGTDPCFVTPVPAAPSDGGDLHVSSTSIAVDSGDNGAAVGSTDAEGATRIQDGTIDRGAYETNDEPAGDISVDDSGNTDFGSVAIGGSGTITYTITNDGSADLTINTISSDDGLFVVGNLSTTLPATLAPAGTMTFDVVYSPTAAATDNANISIGSDDCDEDPYTFGVSGTGVEPGAALHFTTSGDRVDVVGFNWPAGPNQPITVSYWQRSENTATQNSSPVSALGGNAAYSGSNMFWTGNTTNGNYYFRYGTTSRTMASTLADNENVWTHVAFTADPVTNVVKFYQDGVLKSTYTTAFDSPVDVSHIQDIVVGGGIYGYRGKMDELRIYTRALCQDEIVSLMNCEIDGATTDGLYLYYQFNQGIADGDNTGDPLLAIANDASPNNLDGTLTSFTLNGATSNWTTSTITPGTACATYNAQEITVDDSGNTDFGPVIIGSNGTLSYTITNDGTSDLTVNTITSDDGQFVVDNLSTTLPATLGASASMTFDVVFSPSSAGAQSATISIGNDDCDENPYSFSVTGEGDCAVTINSVTPTDEICPDAEDGSISIDASCTGCTGALEYSIDNGTSYQSASLFENLASGDYDIIVRDAGNTACNASGGTVTVGAGSDTTPPTITCPDAISVNTDLDACTATVSVPEPTVTDNCPGPVLGNALNFDGANDYVDLQQVIFANNPSQVYTIEAWVRGTGNGGNRVIFSQYDPNSADRFVFQIATGGGRLQVLKGSTIAQGTTGLHDHQWHHVAVVRESSGLVTLYVDGVAEGTGNNSTGFPSVNARLGNHSFGGGSAYFRGDMDEVRIWNTARTAAEINQYKNVEMVGNEPGLREYYNFNQGVAGGNNAGLTTLNNSASPNGLLRFFGLNGATSNWVSGAMPPLTVINDFNSLANASDSYPLGVTTVEFTATDAAGNSSTCSVNITVTDNQAPDIVCPENIVQSNDTDECEANVTFEATATDNCATTPSITYSQDPGTIFTVGTTTVTATAEDDNGNTSQCMFDVTVNDDQAPVINDCPTGPFTASAALGTCGADISWSLPTATDNCPLVVLSSNFDSGDNFPVGTTVVTYTATDASGNTNSTPCTFQVIVTDNEVPSITACPADRDVNVTPGECQAFITDMTGELMATDNCTLAGIQQTPSAGSTFGSADGDQVTVTFTVFDVYGNNSQCSTVLTLVDNEPPVITCPEDITQANDSGACGAEVTVPLPDVDENCLTGPVVTYDETTEEVTGVIGNQSFDFDFPNTTASAVSNATLEVYVTGGELTNQFFTISDEDGTVLGNTSDGFSDCLGFALTTTFTLSAADINALAADGTVSFTAAASAGMGLTCPPTIQMRLFFDYTLPGYTITNDQNDGMAATGFYPVGTTTVTYTVTDAAGNVSTCMVDVTVNDTEAPVALCEDINLSLDASGNATVTPAMIDNGSTDNCTIASLEFQTGEGPVSSIMYTCDDVGAQAVTLLVTDDSGNTNTCAATVTLSDDTPPVAMCQDVTVTLDSDGNGSTTAAAVNDGSTDNCGITSMTLSQTNFTCDDIPSVAVTLTVEDAAGNSHTCDATVTVVDDEAPVFANCAAAVTVNTDMDDCVATGVALGMPTVDDNCGVASLTNDAPSSFPLGITTVTWTADDGNGNTNTCEQTVTVEDNQAPEIACPAGESMTIGSGTVGTAVSITAGESFQSFTAPMDGNITSITLDFKTISTPGILRIYEGGTCEGTLLHEQTFNSIPANTFYTLVLDTPVPITNGTVYNFGLDATWTFGWSNSNPFSGGRFYFNGCPGNPQFPSGDLNFEMTIESEIANSILVLDENCEVALPDYIAATTATDNCGSPTVTQDPVVGTLYTAPGTHTITMTAADASGNENSCSFEITVVDETPPMVTCPAAVSVNTDTDECFASNVDLGTPTVDDNCTSPTISNNAPTTYNVGVTTVTWTVDDGNGNTSTCDQTVTVTDMQLPNALCQDVTVQLGADGTGSTTAAAVDMGSNDACGIQSLALDVTAFNCDDVGEANPVVLTVTDNNGNQSTCNANVTVLDEVAPTALCQDVTVTLDANGMGFTTAAAVDAGSNDACGIASLSLSQTDFLCGDVPTVSVTLTVTDENGNQSTCDATVTVVDDTPPEAVCQDVTVQLDANGMGSITPGQVDNGSNDACGIQSVVLDITDFDCDDVTVAQTTDLYGRATVHYDGGSVVYDLDESSLVNWVSFGGCAVTRWISTGGDQGWTWADNLPAGSIVTSVDLELSFDFSGTGAAQPYGFNGVPLGSTSGPNDGVNCQSVLTTFTLDGANYIVGGQNTFEWTLGASTFVIMNHSFGVANNGSPVVLTVTDVNGNVSTCNANVTVFDEVPPVALCQDVTVQLDANGVGSITPQQVDMGSNDACGIESLALDITAFNCDDVGEANPVVLTVTDVNGNQSTCNANVTVLDEVAPTALCQDVIVQLGSDGTGTATAAAVDAGSNDACGIATLALDITAFSCDDVGEANPVVLTVTDVNGNQSTCNANVTVLDEVPPTALCQDVTVQLGADGTGTTAAIAVDAGSNDACGIQSLALDVTAFDCDDVGEANPVVLTVTDVNGNQSTCNANVTVLDEVVPVALCQDVTVTLDANGMGFTTAAAVDAGSNDACGIASLSLSQTDFLCGDIPSVSVTLTVTDVNGNQSTCDATVTVIDDTPPIAICQDVTVQLDANGMGSITPEDVDNGSNDACGIQSLVLDITNFDCDDIGGGDDYALSFEDNDRVSFSAPLLPKAVGESGTVSAWVKVPAANTSHSFVVGQYQAGTAGRGDFRVRSDGKLSISKGNLIFAGNGTVNDGNWHHVAFTMDGTTGEVIIYIDGAVDASTTTSTNNIPFSNTNTEINRSYTGGAAMDMDELKIWDVVRSGAEIMVDMNSAATPGEAGLVAYYQFTDGPGSSSLTDNSGNGNGGTLVGFDPANAWSTDTPGITGPSMVTLTVTDNNGNVSTCTANVTVLDEVAPVALCQDVTVQLDAAGMGSITPEQVDMGSNDACGVESLALDITAFNCDDVGEANPVVLTVTDVNGNESTCNANVTVLDEVAPVALCQDVIVQLDVNGMGSTTAAAVDAGSNDACGIQSLSLSQTSFVCDDIPSVAVVLTVTDNNGNVSTCDATVTVEDNVAPDALCQDVTVQLDENGMGSITTDDIDAGSDDACGIQSLVLDITNFDCDDVTTTESGAESIILDQSSSNGSTPMVFGPYAQNFTVASNTNMTRFRVNANVFYAAGDILFEVFEGDAGTVGPHALLASETVPLTGTGWVEATFSNPAALSTGQTYYVRVTAINGAAGHFLLGFYGGLHSPASGTPPYPLTGGGRNITCIGYGAEVIANTNTVTLTVTDNNGNVSTCEAEVTVLDEVPPVALCQDLTVQLDAAGMGSITPEQVDMGSNDACGIESLALDVTAFNCDDVNEANPVTLTVTDVNGNVSTCDANITVLDEVPPVALCQDVVVSLDENGSGSTTAGAVDAGSNDACGIASLVLSQTDFDCSHLGDNEVTLTVTDVNNNVSTCNANVSVIDEIPPVVTNCPVDIFLVTASNTCSQTTFWNAPTMEDNCVDLSYTLVSDRPGEVVINDLGSFAFAQFPVGVTIVTYTVTDGSGNETICSFEVTVEDQTNPTITNCPIDQEVNVIPGTCEATATWVAPTATDNCLAGLTMTSTHAPGASFPLGVTTVTYTAVDNSGNEGTCSFDITVVDNEAPYLDCPGEVLADNADDCTYVVPDLVALVNATENCTGTVSITQNIPEGTLMAAPMDVTITAEDAAGNTSTCVISVTWPEAISAEITASTAASCAGVSDGSATVTASGGTTPYTYLWDDLNAQTTATATGLASGTYNVTVTDDNGCEATATVEIGEASNIVLTLLSTDASCDGSSDGIATVNVEGGTPEYDYLWSDPSAQTTPVAINLASGDYTVTVTDANGCTAIGMVNVGGLDTEDPVAVCQDITVELDESGNASIAADQVDGGSTDNCEVESLSIDVSSFTCDDIGPNTVTLTVTDVNGMTATCEATVTVEDNIGADLPMCGELVTIQLDENGNAVLTVEDLGVPTDNCTPSEEILVTINGTTTYGVDDVGQVYNLSATTLDGNGNSETCLFTITVVDLIPPVALCQPTVLFLDANGQVGLTPEQIDAGSTDNHGIASMSVDPNSFDCTNTDANEVTLTVTDLSGNVGTCMTTVVVLDVAPPVAICNDLTVVLDENGMGSITVAEVDGGSNDNCGLASQTLSQTDFDCSHVGANTVTMTIMDPSGNTTSCTSTVTVEDNEFPTLEACNGTVNLTLDENGTVSLAIEDLGVAADNCGTPTVEIVGNTDFTCANIGDNNRLVAVTDANGNQITCFVNISIADDLAPVAECVEEITLSLDGNGMATLTTDMVDDGSFDNCDIASYSLDVTEFDCSNVASANEETALEFDGSSEYVNLGSGIGQSFDQITLEAWVKYNVIGADKAILVRGGGAGHIGFSANGYFQFKNGAGAWGATVYFPNTINDTDWHHMAAVYDKDAGASINDQIQIYVDGNPVAYSVVRGTISEAIGASVESANIGRAPWGASYLDGSVDELRIWEVARTQAEIQATMNAALSGGEPGLVHYYTFNDASGLSLTDQVGGVSGTLTNMDDTDWVEGAFGGAGSGGGPTTVTMTVTDDSGNSSTCETTVTVIDELPPVMACQDVQISLDANGAASITTGMIDNGSADNCTMVSLSLDQTDFDCADLGSNTVTLTGTDDYGNSSSCDATVTVVDEIPPTLASCGSTLNPALDVTGAASITVADLGAAMDNCDVTTVTILGRANYNCADLAAPVTVPVSVADGSGNSTECDVFVQVVDNIDPTALCQDYTVNIGESGSETINAAQINAGSFDNCSLASLSVSPNTFTCADVGTTPTVTLTVTDGSGNTHSCDATVTVVDETAPMVSCVAGIDLELDQNGEASITAEDVELTSSDNCSAVTLSLEQTLFTCDDLGNNTILLTATDASGNEATCTTQVTVEDNLAPIVEFCNQEIILILDGDGQAILTEDDLGNIDENCGTYFVSFFGQTVFGPDDVGTSTNVLTVIVDANNNPTVCNMIVTIEDDGDPIAVCMDATVGLGADGTVTVTPEMVDGGSTDAGGIANMTVMPSDFTCDDIGEQTVTLTVTDISNNKATCFATVTIVDDLGPNMLCQDMTVVLDANGMASITPLDIDAGSTDNCAETISLSLDQEVFMCGDLGTNTVTLTGTDDYNNSSTCEATVTVLDQSAPTLATCDQTVNLPLDDNGLATLTAEDLGAAEDNCGPVTVTILGQTDFSCTDLSGPVAVSVALSDPSNNTNICTVNVQAVDETAPVANCIDDIVYLDAAGNATLDAALIGTGSTDNCGVASYSLDIPTVGCADLGDVVVELTVADASGNESTCSSTVTVVDDLAPIAQCQNVTIVLDDDGLASTTASAVDAGSTDNCGVSSLSLSQTDFDCSHIGDNTVTLTVEDASGNSSTCEATVTVVDDSVPVPDFCGATFTLELDQTGTATLDESVLNVADNCGEVTLYFIGQTTFTCADVGNQVLVTLIIIDAGGNYVVCNFFVDVVDPIMPVVVCESNVILSLTEGGIASLTPEMVDAGSTDNCSDVTLSIDLDNFSCNDVGTSHPVTLTVEDAAGNSSQCMTNVEVEDVTPPTVVCQDITVSLDQFGGATITADQVVSSSQDACGVDNLAVLPATFDCDDTAAPQLVTVTATDVNGNTSDCTALVTVVDDTAPTPAYCGGTLEVALDASGNADLTLDPAVTSVTDNCSTLTNYFIGQTAFTCADVGNQYLTTIIFLDEASNYTVCNTFVDVTDPTGNCSAAPLVGNPDRDRPERMAPLDKVEGELKLTEVRALPNPFQVQMKLEYRLSVPAEVGVTIWSEDGQMVQQRRSLPQAAGLHHYFWRPEANVPSGTYYLRLQVDGQEVRVVPVQFLR